ncbi:methyltransferase domain-containing protein [Gracilibacillus salitolerans]|uniref:Methyltransferase domain-containing protein n=1 Tax=Gracilibacillus salitolerans TaxID=2663022 RepID=A0A5Q2TM27_9BACI|nr:class I SAM-dependent methyltransferase [Gracilibacillus salitolerans]QGH35033.1 methyltransferase domain-containing protein [Gracilibacillus salitolerans]
MVYSKLAYIYDVLMDDAPYDQWQTFVEHFGNQGKMLDLGCGTGRLSHLFSNVGFSVTGVDFSEDMLAYAQANTTGVQYIQQDIRELEGLTGFDVVISLCDVINYITSVSDLEKVFANVRKTLADSGLFIFDVHSLKHFEENMAGQTFAEIYDDISYVWFCEQGEETGSVEHDLTFFLLNEETGQYERFDEQHSQRTFGVETYKELLKKVGFQSVAIHVDFSIEESSEPEESQRIFFICKR